MIRHLKASDLRRMPWKNGRGSTLEIASDATPGASDWTWRVSVADVPESGPFSRFPGFERIIACVEGNGMRLAIGGREAIDVPRSGAGLRFSGDDATEGLLIDGPVRDANLFLKRGVWEGELMVLREAAAAEISGDGSACVYVVAGECTLAVRDTVTTLVRGEAALVEAMPAGLTLRQGSTLLLVTFRSRS